jgi:hypothetical protein
MVFGSYGGYGWPEMAPPLAAFPLTLSSLPPSAVQPLSVLFLCIFRFLAY